MKTTALGLILTAILFTSPAMATGGPDKPFAFYNPVRSEYLVLTRDRSVATPMPRVEAFDHDGTVKAGTEFVIDANAYAGVGAPRVAVDLLNKKALVVWGLYVSAGPMYRVAGALIDLTDNTPSSVFMVDDSGVVPNGGTSIGLDVAYATESQKYLVVWGSGLEIMARNIDADGTLFNAPFTFYDNAESDEVISVRVAYGDARDEFMVAWQTYDADSPYREITRAAIHAPGSSATAGSLQLEIMDDSRIPAVAYDLASESFAVVYQDISSGSYLRAVGFDTNNLQATVQPIMPVATVVEGAIPFEAFFNSDGLNVVYPTAGGGTIERVVGQVGGAFTNPPEVLVDPADNFAWLGAAYNSDCGGLLLATARHVSTDSYLDVYDHGPTCVTGLSASPTTIDFGTVVVGNKPVLSTLAKISYVADDFAPATLSAPSPFKIIQDQCQGITVPHAGTCAVKVSAEARTVGNYTGSLLLSTMSGITKTVQLKAKIVASPFGTPGGEPAKNVSLTSPASDSVGIDPQRATLIWSAAPGAVKSYRAWVCKEPNGNDCQVTHQTFSGK